MSAVPAGSAAPRPGYRSLVLEPAFRVFWSAQLLTLVGDFFSFVALSWLILDVTGSGLALGGVLAAQAVPRAVLMLIGGAASDRFSARGQMLASSVARALLTGLLAVLAIAHRATLPEIYLLAVLLGAVAAFFIPARSAMLPSVVADAQLESGNAALQLSQQAAAALGPALAGVVVAAAGPGWAIAADAAAFAVAAVLLTQLQAGSPRPAAQAPAGMWDSIRAGLALAWTDVSLRAVLVLILVVNLAFTGPLEVGLAVLARARLGGAWAFGACLAAWGAGAIVGALVAGMVRIPRFGPVLCAGIGGMGAVLGLVGFLPWLGPVIALMGVAGFGNGFVLTHGMTWLQRRVPQLMLGRVMSIVMLAGVGLAPLAFAMGGMLAQIRTDVLFGTAGAVVVIASAGAYASRAVRSM